MKTLIAYPPNYKEILAVFPAIVGKPVVFAYGDTLYNPTSAIISNDLMAHEETHEKQQKVYRGGVENWWKEYLTNPAFRLEQEVEAYRAQYKFFCSEQLAGVYQSTRGRSVRKAFLHKIASDLSGPVYGKLCSYQRAADLISKTYG